MVEKKCITAVISVFNMNDYLRRFMDTFLQQRYVQEIILVDDGSTDGSASICDEYKTKYPELIRVIHKENGGLSSARNAGIDAANGEYIIFPDPDDWVELGYTQRLIELQEQYHSELVCIGHYINYDDKQLLGKEGQEFLVTSGKMAQKLLVVQPCISSFAWDKLYHLEIIRKNNLRFLNDVGTREDVDFVFRYLEYCMSVCYDPESRLYHYYQRSGAATHSGFSQKKLDTFHTYEKIIESTEDSELIQAAREEICNTAINLIWLYQNSEVKNREQWRQLRKKMSENLDFYFKSKHLGAGRKIQACLAYYSPRLYAWLKNRFIKQ